MSRKRDIAIIGTGLTRFGELFDQSYDDLVREAALQAVADAGIGLDDIQAGWLSTAFPEIGVFKGRSGMDLVEPLNLYGIPVTRVSNFCASGSDAIRNAANALAAGECDVAMVLGVEKLRDRTPQDSIVKMMVELSHPFFQKGFTAAGTFAVYARRIMHKYGVTLEDIANISVKNHYHGTMNEKAHHRIACSLEQVLSSPMVAAPLTVMDSCPTTDGAACLIMVRAADVDKSKHAPVYIDGIGLAISTGWDMPFFDPKHDFCSFQATRDAAAMAYKQAGISKPLDELDLIEVHDCFSIVELITYEDLGLCKAGEAKDMIRGKATCLGGEIPVNVSGGLLSCGHPVGATGVRMVVEVVSHLRGIAGDRQVKGAKRGLTHNIGGPGAIASVIVLNKEQ
ncbi:MAG: acetyl-CoA acetyltransferase [Saprospiraceae bacterium]|nr:acetyl-CoA acetyltransferase [Saprospiraceae bacterium]